MCRGYSSLSSLRTHDLTQAIHIHIHQNNHHIINLSLMDSGMECNQNIVGGGVCVDTRYIRSLAYIPMSFTGGRVYTYTSYNGDGEMTITTYEEPIHTHKLGAYTTYTTYRHTVGNWYAQAFTSHTHSHTHTHIEDHTHQQYTHTHTHTHTHTGTPPGVYVSTNTAPNSTHCATCAPYTSGSSHMFGM
ncbi:hypothetical protein EON63_06580 [archaeon]|nr:MAG: hypothetical protein EON63_06580 [archaeon]